ncbi:leptomycin efflux transporter Pmd1 [Schizosaccharomyces octosporus yFS286]|uniref:Leptomycin efflux transporter Pmd1 n=1 Tax=Schizosaccharomyces octosporus (strain yFS286) TaxID=483514 RepID=S9QXW0_SCHOY|nr:leptomycin efflux transporter Pmd1 [Schizosaccharomyces octosporus yFS286]EPX71095.1 leptomycin efflux transporter Pmd1 [Schizosaccharomyces octosporus yFS286]
MTDLKISASKKSNVEENSEHSLVVVDQLPSNSLNNPEEILEVVEDPFAKYTAEEREILYRQINDSEAKVAGYTRILTCNDKWDYLLQLIGCLTAIGAGLGLPFLALIAGKLSKVFTDYFSGQNVDNFQHSVNQFVLYFVYIAIGVFGCSFVYTVAFIVSGERISREIRKQYLHAVLSQNVGYFDHLGAGEITTRITSDTNYIQDGLGEKVGLVLSSASTFVSGFVIGFIRAWKFTLIISSMLLAILGGMTFGISYITKYSKPHIGQLSSSSSFVEEVFSNVRNALAFGTQRLLTESYAKFLSPAKRYGTKRALVMGVMTGWMFFVSYGYYGLAFWEGGRLLHAGELNVDKLISCFFAVMTASYSLANITPQMQAFANCASAAKKIFDTIDRTSPINIFSSSGKQLEKVHGEVELKNVRFVYPTRPEVVVLDDFSLLCPAGKITALVGASGSGKSTIIGLVERFYDPIAGQVMLDGEDIGDLNTAWLRSHISLVQQEPVLFAVSVFENIAFGLIDNDLFKFTEDEVRERVFCAAKTANAYEFIMTLPEKFDTNVGQQGFLLSGGQKQRIAIARAIISDPKILLLDEATSALDTNSEVSVQKALEDASKSRTTIVVAHRLSTIRNADNIVVVNAGKIVEQGTHSDLLSLNGAYAKLVEMQKFRETNNDDAVIIEEENIDGSRITVAQSGNDDSSSKEIHPVNQEKVNGTISLRNIPLTKLPMDGVPDLSKKSLDNIGDESTDTDSTSKLESNVAKMSTWRTLVFIHSFVDGALEIAYVSVGILASMVCGAAYPVQAVVNAWYMNIFANVASPDYFHQVNTFAVYWLILAIAEFFGHSMSQIAMSYMSESILLRIRRHVFSVLIRQDIEFFDRSENSVGTLTTSLSTSIQNLEGLTGTTLGTFMQIFTNIVSVSILSLILGWKLSLVILATSPVMIASGYYRVAALDRIQNNLSEACKASAAFACESTSAIKTVASLTRESKIYEHYCASLVQPGKETAFSSMVSAFLFAASQAVTFLVNGLGFWYGATLVRKGEYNLVHFFTCYIGVVYGVQQAGQVLGYAADVSKAKSSAASIKYICDSKPKIDTWSEEGLRIETLGNSSIVFEAVRFHYPTRKHIQVLRGLNLTIKPGQFVAFVGASGCGKSTMIGLIERFYDCQSGSIKVGGVDIREYNINDYREQIALVSQEPTLYQGTIRENIVLGASRDVRDEEIIECCKMANIHDFIMGLPNGYETLSGRKGSSFSGGQKQRIAIARALIRNPKILLLDEATSALDSYSEKVVQEVLNRASEGRTTVAIAHRLSSIQHADCIFVLDKGIIVETGTHSELVKKGGRYHELVIEQGLGN